MATGPLGDVRCVNPSPNPLVLSEGGLPPPLPSHHQVQRRSRVSSIKNNPPNSYQVGVRALPAFSPNCSSPPFWS